MTFFVHPEREDWQHSSAPKFSAELFLLDDIVGTVPAAHLLYEGQPDADHEPRYPSQVIGHTDPRLGQVKEGLDDILLGYQPPETPPTNVSIVEYMPKEDWEGDYIREEEMRGILNYAAHTLREVIVFAQQRKQDIKVN